MDTPEVLGRREEISPEDAAGRAAAAVLHALRGRQSIGRHAIVVVMMLSEGETGTSATVQRVDLQDSPALTRSERSPLAGTATLERQKGGLCIFRLEGEFTGGNCAEVALFKDLLLEGIRDVKRPKVVLNCQGMRKTASDGYVPPFNILYRRVSEAEGRMTLCNVPDHVREDLQLKRLETAMPIHENEKEAIAALRRRRQRS